MEGSIASSKVVAFEGAIDGREAAHHTTDNSVDLRGRRSNKYKTGRWKSAVFICGLTVADTMCVIGIAGNLVSYLIFTLYMTEADAGNLVTNFVGVNYLLPVVWGFLADAYLGRFLTISMSCIVLFMGLVMLTVQAAKPSLLPPPCNTYPQCPEVSSVVMNRFLGGLFLVALGSAGIKPCSSSLGQDQFDEGDPLEKKQQGLFFTALYASIDLGSLISFSLLVWLENDVGWDWGFGLVLGSFVLGAMGYWIATPLFRHQKPRGSPFTRLAQVIVAAITNSKLQLPPNSSDLHEMSNKECSMRGLRKVEHSDRLGWLDKAAIKQQGVNQADSPWKLCTVTQVEDMKTIIQILPIWLTNITVWTIYAQLMSFSIGQALSVDRRLFGSNTRFTIPPASLTLFLLLAAFAVIPIWEYVVVPCAKPRGGVTSLQRIAVGQVVAVFSMVSAALAERKRVGIIRDKGLSYQDLLAGAVPMSVWWLVPQYVILGFTEIIMGVAQLEFFFEQVPDGMKSVGTALFFGIVSMGYFFSSVLVTAVNSWTRKHGYGWLDADGIVAGGLEKYYWLLSLIVAVSTVTFILLAKFQYHYKQLVLAP